MTAHPYPQKVVDAVQKQMDWAGATAEVALSALWEASRVDAFGDLAGLPGSAIIANGEGNTASLNDFLGIQEVGSPAHIIYWGDRL